MDTPRGFYENKIYLIIQIIAAVFMFIAGILQLAMKHQMGWFYLILGVGMIFIGVLRRSYAIIEFRTDALTLKKAPAFARKILPYSQITHAEIVSAKKVKFHYENEGQKDVLALPLNGISGADRLEVMDIIKSNFRVEEPSQS